MTDAAVPECIFCRIVAKEVPSELVAENDAVIAVRDISPVASTHVLLIPRRHLQDATALGREEAELLGEIFALANEVAELEDVRMRGFRIVANVGDDAGNTVSHLHFHCIGGRALAWPPG